MTETGKEQKEQRTMRLSFPTEDTALMAWLDEQTSPSLSVRMLAKEAITTYGIRDYPIALIEAAAPVKVKDPTMLKIDVASEDPIATAKTIESDLLAAECQSYMRGDVVVRPMADRVRVLVSPDALCFGDVSLHLGFGANHG